MLLIIINNKTCFNLLFKKNEFPQKNLIIFRTWGSKKILKYMRTTEIEKKNSNFLKLNKKSHIKFMIRSTICGLNYNVSSNVIMWLGWNFPCGKGSPPFPTPFPFLWFYCPRRVLMPDFHNPVGTYQFSHVGRTLRHYLMLYKVYFEDIFLLNSDLC